MLSKFLNNLLAPIYLYVARRTTFVSDIDLVRKLENYVKDGYFTYRTIFITADVKDLYTMIPREGALQAFPGRSIRLSDPIGSYRILFWDHTGSDNPTEFL